MIADKQKGISLIITFFIMIIILAVVLAISTLLYSQIKVIRNIGNSVIAFYAADSGVEKVLFYDKQVIPDGAVRGLCSMLRPLDATNNPNPCLADSSPLSCNAVSPATSPYMGVIDPTNPDGCDVDKCNNCEIDFSTNVNDDKSYVVKATVSPDPDGESTDFSINSAGSYKDVTRAINIFITKATPQQVITVVYAIATPRSVPNGVAIDIQTEVKSPNGISTVTAHIKNSPDATTWTAVPLTCGMGFQDRNCIGSQTFPSGVYYVDIDIIDGHNIEFLATNIPPYMP